MKISRMNKGDWGKVKAFFDLETVEGFTIKGFKIVEGSDGTFIGFPSQKKDDEYFDTVFADKELKQEVRELAKREYDNPSERQQDLEPVSTPEELPF